MRGGGRRGDDNSLSWIKSGQEPLIITRSIIYGIFMRLPNTLAVGLTCEACQHPR